MKLTYKLSAAFFCAAAGMIVAAALPNWTAGLVVGIALMAIGAVLMATSMQQGVQSVKDMRKAEQEQMVELLSGIQESLNQLHDDLCANQKEAQANRTQNAADAAKLQDQLSQLSETAQEVEKLTASITVHMEKHSAQQNEQLKQLEETIVEAKECLHDRQKSVQKDLVKSLDDLKDAVSDKADTLNDTVTDGLRDLTDKLEDLFEDVAKAGLEDVQKEVGNLNTDITSQFQKLSDAMETFRETSEALSIKLENFHKNAEATLGGANAAAQKQLDELEAFLKEENEKNQSSTERIMKIYASLTEQDAKLLQSLGIKGSK